MGPQRPEATLTAVRGRGVGGMDKSIPAGYGVCCKLYTACCTTLDHLAAGLVGFSKRRKLIRIRCVVFDYVQEYVPARMCQMHRDVTT